jgi:hypothetical protein
MFPQLVSNFQSRPVIVISVEIVKRCEESCRDAWMHESHCYDSDGRHVGVGRVVYARLFHSCEDTGE